ncbi:MAG: HAD-IIB family hydrolase [Polyangiales bacterium]
MIPLAKLPVARARAIDALLFDLDDTVLSHGSLTRAAYDAICDLAAAGVALVAVTGRPAGWGEVLARQWPLLGVVSENGAALCWRQDGAIVGSMRGTAASLADDRSRLEAIAAEVHRALPAIVPADDNAARRTDLTLDVGEQVQIPPADVARARAIIHAGGARSILSSIHLHATFSGDDKASGVQRLLRERLGWSAGTARARAAFIGDSENDAACFAAFPTSFGVANVARWAPRLSLPPRWITPSPMGAGFAELVAAILAARENQGLPAPRA